MSKTATPTSASKSSHISRLYQVFRAEFKEAGALLKERGWTRLEVNTYPDRRREVWQSPLGERLRCTLVAHDDPDRIEWSFFLMPGSILGRFPIGPGLFGAEWQAEFIGHEKTLTLLVECVKRGQEDHPHAE